MRCGKCGNENAEGNRFCGMCGAPLLAKPMSVGAPAAPARSGAPVGLPGTPTVMATSRPATETRRAPLPSADDGPIITGPSFLGLNQPARGSRLEAHDSGEGSSGSLSYLLEEEEEPRRGWGKLILVLLALALAGGFGYLHWRQGGLDWLNGEKKPAAAPTEAAPSGADSGSVPANAQASPTEAAPAQVAPKTTGTVPATGSAAENPPAGSGAQSSQAATPETSVPQAAEPQSKANDASAPAQSATAGEDAESDEEPAAKKPTTRTKVEARRAGAKPSAAKPVAAKPVDAAGEAERYIYGRGVKQDCDHGLRLLQPAAAQANPSAMISLGALYSTGMCTPRDLPTAYRWFALALHKQPDNRTLQDDLQKLWSQMTQPERQLAIKLSQ